MEQQTKPRRSGNLCLELTRFTPIIIYPYDRPEEMIIIKTNKNLESADLGILGDGYRIVRANNADRNVQDIARQRLLEKGLEVYF